MSQVRASQALDIHGINHTVGVVVVDFCSALRYGCVLCFFHLNKHFYSSSEGEGND